MRKKIAQNKIRYLILLAGFIALMVAISQGCGSSNGNAPGSHVIYGATS